MDGGLSIAVIRSSTWPGIATPGMRRGMPGRRISSKSTLVGTPAERVMSNGRDDAGLVTLERRQRQRLRRRSRSANEPGAEQVGVTGRSGPTRAPRGAAGLSSLPSSKVSTGNPSGSRFWLQIGAPSGLSTARADPRRAGEQNELVVAAATDEVRCTRHLVGKHGHETRDQRHRGCRLGGRARSCRSSTRRRTAARCTPRPAAPAETGREAALELDADQVVPAVLHVHAALDRHVEVERQPDQRVAADLALDLPVAGLDRGREARRRTGSCSR